MRRKERKIEDKNIINRILNESHICRIAIFDDLYPYIVPMNYGYKENSIYFHCAPEGKKIDLIKRNNNVSFEIENFHKIMKNTVSCKWTTNYQSIIGYGEIEIITNFEEKKKGLDILMIHHGKKDNIYKDEEINRISILKLNISSLTAKQSGD